MKLPTRDRWCVEFGAWDGIFFSNTRLLIEQRGYSAVLIEPDATKYAGLVRNCAAFPDRLTTMNCFVGLTADADNNLDRLLQRTTIPTDFDLLTIDIEGNDQHAWAAMSAYRPKIVHIPYNPSIPTEVEYTQPCDPQVAHGPSLKGLVRLGKEKGYELICVTHNSAYFVRVEDFPLFGVTNNDPAALRQDTSRVTYLWTSYDGNIHVSGYDQVLHYRNMSVHQRIRALPSIFRCHLWPGNWSWWRHKLYGAYWRLDRFRA